MAEDNFGKNILDGMNSGMGMVHKAYELEKQRADLDTQKEAVSMKKFDLLQGEMRSIYMVPRGPARKKMIERSRGRLLAGNINHDPAVLELAENDDYQADILGSFDDILNLGVTDPKAQAQARNNIIAATGDYQQALGAITKRREMQTEIAKKKQGDELTAAESLKLLNETATQVKGEFGDQIASVNAVKKIMAIGSTKEKRESPMAKDSVNVLLAKLQDPLTGVRSQELDRITGLGEGAGIRAYQSLQNFALGTGKLSEKQWKDIIKLADAYGSLANDDIATHRSSREGAYKKAGLDANQVYAGIPKYERFDFEKGGFRTLGPNTAQQKALNEKEAGAKSAQQKLNSTGKDASKIEAAIKKAEEAVAAKMGR